MVICNINKEKFKNFVGTLSLREESLEEIEDDSVVEFHFNVGNKEYSIQVVTFKIEDGNFVGSHWDEKLSELFRSNKK